MANDHTDPALRETASKLQLKEYVQVYFLNVALLFLRRHHNIAAATKNANIGLPESSVSDSRERLVEKATSDFLREWGAHFWSSYVKKRQHLTVLSPHGDNVRGRTARLRQYKLEREAWLRGRLSERPAKPVNTKGLVYLGEGRPVIEQWVRKYFDRIVEMGDISDIQSDPPGELGPVGCRPSPFIQEKVEEWQSGLSSSINATQQPTRDRIDPLLYQAELDI